MTTGWSVEHLAHEERGEAVFRHACKMGLEGHRTGMSVEKLKNAAH
jgi:hypothetical protein